MNDDAKLNMAVTNIYEQIVFLILLLLHIFLIAKLGVNFSTIVRWHLKIKLLPTTLYCVNTNLLIMSCVKIVTYSYGLIGSLLDLEQNSYFSIPVYTYLSQIYIIFFNMILLVVANSWLSVLCIRYPKRQKFVSTLLSWLTKYNILISIASFTILQIAISSNDLIQVNYIIVLVSTAISGAVFGFSSINFYWSIKHIITVANKIKFKLRCLNIILILTTIDRVLTYFSKLFLRSVLIDIKSYNTETKTDDGISWAFLQLEYFFICDFLPLLILSVLFTPDVSVDKRTIIESVIEITKDEIE